MIMNSGGTLLCSHPGVGCGFEPPMVSSRETRGSILGLGKRVSLLRQRRLGLSAGREEGHRKHRRYQRGG